MMEELGLGQRMSTVYVATTELDTNLFNQSALAKKHLTKVVEGPGTPRELPFDFGRDEGLMSGSG